MISLHCNSRDVGVFIWPCVGVGGRRDVCGPFPPVLHLGQKLTVVSKDHLELTCVMCLLLQVAHIDMLYGDI
jgi:hypothetical protein